VKWCVITDDVVVGVVYDFEKDMKKRIGAFGIEGELQCVLKGVNINQVGYDCVGS